ncbi:HAD-IIB family hydrolase [uncultured Abyssibacter sp.]|uniref:HAD-IIB family hydrolase n=1 Tax=uncultured Abyssibacter sp. TaxID=2320202 RepID=UPI0032B122D5
MTPVPPAVVFTDLDGTLLGHHDYSVDGALPGLERCAALGVPVIPTTSKTAAETGALMRRLQLDWACIVENGSAAILPGHSPWAASLPHTSALCFGIRREQIGDVLGRLRAETGARFTAFSEMSHERIAELTGLSLADAAQAAARDYSEPLHWEDTAEQLEAFEAAVLAAGLQCLRGGRFVHVLGRTDKGKAARALLDAVGLTRCPMIALGDAGNDEALIAAADVGVWVRSPRGSAPPTQARRLTLHTRALAPSGWTEGVNAALNACIGDDRESARGIA